MFAHQFARGKKFQYQADSQIVTSLQVQCSIQDHDRLELSTLLLTQVYYLQCKKSLSFQIFAVDTHQVYEKNIKFFAELTGEAACC